MIRKGTYILFMTFPDGLDVTVGALGECHLDPGRYCYVGSAMGGLDQRVGRHLSYKKTMRWHIDRLTINAKEMRAYESYPDPIPECELGHIVIRYGALPVINGFGCSDCHCRTHLFVVNGDTEERIVSSCHLLDFSKRISVR